MTRVKFCFTVRNIKGANIAAANHARMRWGQEWGFRYSTAFNPQMSYDEYAESAQMEYEFHPISVKCKLCTKSLTDTQERMEQAGWIFTTEGVACDKCIHRHITQILREAGRMSICERVIRDTQMHQRQLDAERGN